MSVGYHDIGAIPDVCEGNNHIHILKLGSLDVQFSLTPEQGDLFRRDGDRAARHIREERSTGRCMPLDQQRRERDRHLRLLGCDPAGAPPRIDPFTYAPQRDRPSVWRQRLAFTVFLVGLAVIGFVAINMLSGAK